MIIKLIKNSPMLVVFIACLSSSTLSAATFPIDVILLPDGAPLAIVVGMESKPGRFVGLQVDTGAPISLVYEFSNNLDRIHENLLKINDFESISEFVGDTGKRFRIRLSSEFSSSEEVMAMITLPYPSKLAGVVGLNWFKSKRVDLSFAEKKMEISEVVSTEFTKRKDVFLEQKSADRNSRLLINVCRDQCVDMIFDTGVAFSDIVEFVTIQKLKEDALKTELTRVPGILSGVLCTLPKKTPESISVSGQQYKNLYHSKCAFVESGEIYPKESVFGVRTIIESKGSISINYNSNQILFRIGK